MRAVLVLLALALPLAAPPVSPLAPSAEPGLRHYVLPDGFEMWTHGPDYISAIGTPWGGNVVPKTPACVADWQTQHHNHILYAHVGDRANNHAAMVPTLRATAAESAGLVDAAAARYGHSANIRFRCDADGQVTVTYVHIPAGASYQDIVYAIRNAGHQHALAKYWVYYDGPSPNGAAGEAMVPSGSQPGVDHPSNTQGPYYGVNYMQWHWTVMLHEAAHTMGAVQSDAPHGTWTHHCTDGQDLMCYEGGTDFNVCPIGSHFDCRGDDYFHPAPPAGSYLATHWNLGHPDNLFMETAAGNARPSAPASLTATRGPGIGEITVSWTPTTWTGGGAATGYRVLTKDTDHRTKVVGDHAVNVTQQVVTGLKNGTVYRFVVVPYNAAGEGGMSDGASAKTFAVPSAPRNLTATSGVQKVNLIFEPPLDDGGLPITGYRAVVDHYPIGGRAFERDLNVGQLVAGKLNAVVWMEDTGTYRFHVVAVNAVGQSWTSNGAVSAAASS